MGVSLILVFVAISVIIFQWCYGMYRKHKMVDKIQGPPVSLPGIGFQLPANVYEVTTTLKELFAKYGDNVKLYIGGSLYILTCDASLTGDLLKSTTPSHLYKSQLYDLTRDWLKDGIVLSIGSKWQNRRKYLTPSFNYSILKTFFHNFNESSDILINKMDEQAAKGAIINVGDLISRYSIDVFGETVLGINLDFQVNGDQTFIQAANFFGDTFTIRNFSHWKRFDLPFKLFANEYQKHVKSTEILLKTTDHIIKHRRKELSENAKKDASGEDSKLKFNFIDALLQNPDLTDEDIEEEVSNFLFAGFDTNATIFSFLIYELAKWPAIQEKMYNELNAAVNADISNLTADIIPNLTYLEQVLKEILRFRTPIPIIERKLEEDAKLGGVVYPKGTTISMVLYYLHHNTKYFSNPEKFDPDRFGPDSTEKPPPFAYVPFSAGIRNCMGQKFAQMAIKTALAKMIMKFKILPAEGIEEVVGLSGTLKLKNGLVVKMKRREE